MGERSQIRPLFVLGRLLATPASALAISTAAVLLLLVTVPGCTKAREGLDFGAGGDGRSDLGGWGDFTLGLEGRTGDAPWLQGDLPPGGTISIYLKGDLVTAYPYPYDGAQGQTVSDFYIAISRYSIMKTATDTPQVCFDHGSSPAVANLWKDNLVGYCLTKDIPTGNYGYGRTKVDWSAFAVSGTLHAFGQSLPGSFTFFRAYSDTTYQGKKFSAGDGTATFSGAVTFTVPISYPALTSTGGVHFDTKNGECNVTFPFSKPLPIVQTNTDKHWARFNWRIKDAFRWNDSYKSGYAQGTWDVSSSTYDTELITSYGVAGYSVTSSVDK
jgi:hypothetical protein